MPFVCVQPMMTSWARRSEDLTFDKTDEKDAVLIARLAAQLRCYVPEPVDETWGRLRHLGARREQLIGEAVSQVQQIRDLLECVWPAALESPSSRCAPRRGRPRCRWSWTATAVTLTAPDDSVGAVRTAVRREITKRGGQKPCLRIAHNLYAALADPAGVIAHRPGALERVQLLLEDWSHNQHKLADTETRMTGVLEELGLTELVTSITGLSRGRCCHDPCRDRRPTPVCHRESLEDAGLAPREKLSGPSSAGPS